MMDARRAWRIAGLLALAVGLYVAPSGGALGLAKLLAVGCYFLVFVARSPCRSGAAYPFAHGFRSGAGCPVSRQPGTTSAGVADATAPSTRLPAIRTAPEATSRSARG
jgi:hypothetical protein